MPSLSTTEDAGVLWLATLQRALARASHDVKDALNGVSVNLEVIRSRAARSGAEAAPVAPFAEAARQQLERLTTLIEAVLALGRAEREPVDVGAVLRRVATLCNASSSTSDGAVEVVGADGDPVVTPVRGEVVRLALAGPLLELVTSNGTMRGARSAKPVRCAISTGGAGAGGRDMIVVTLSAPGRAATMPDALADVLRAAGVRWMNGVPGKEEEQGNGTGDLSLVFPRA